MKILLKRTITKDQLSKYYSNGQTILREWITDVKDHYRKVGVCIKCMTMTETKLEDVVELDLEIDAEDIK